MTEHTTTIAGYRVTVDTDMGDGATGCWIERGNFSASIEAADATGVLTDSGDREQPIAAGIVARIRTWAEGRGY